MRPIASECVDQSGVDQHPAKPLRQATPPSHTAKPHRQATPPTDTAKRGAGQRAPSAARDHSPPVESVSSHLSVLINPGWINIRPSHTAKSHRQVTPPSHSAKSLRQVTPPSHSAKSLRQVTPPSDSAAPLGALAPPRPAECQSRHFPNFGEGWSRSSGLSRHSGVPPCQCGGLGGLRSPTWRPSLPAYRRSSPFNPGFPDGTRENQSEGKTNLRGPPTPRSLPTRAATPSSRRHPRARHLPMACLARSSVTPIHRPHATPAPTQ